MSRPIFRLAAVLQIVIVLATGCAPTQPFFIANDPGRANFIAQSMSIDFADVHVDSLQEVAAVYPPFGPGNLPEEFLDYTLEDCIAIALNNSKILRVVPGSNANSGSILDQILSATPGQMPSRWDPAIVSTRASSQPAAVDNQGNRIAPRSLIRANQVGGVEDALSEFDAQFFAVMGYNTTDRPRNVAPGNVFNPQFFQARDANALAAFSKRMATGTVATARFTTIYSSNNIPTPTPQNPNNFGRNVPSDYTATVELQVNQPLLRGRGTLVNRIPVVLARINEDIALHEFETNVRNLIRDVEFAYWNLYCGYQVFRASKDAHNSALELWKVAKARNDIGEGAPEAEAQARSQLKLFEGRLTAALYGSRVQGNEPEGLLGREMVLREKMGLGACDGKLLRPADQPNLARVHFDWYEVHAEALARNTELRRQKWAIKQRELELILAKNHTLPQFDLVSFYRWVGVGDEFAAASRNGIDFPSAGSNAIESLTGGDYQEVGVRAELTPHAFGKVRAEANLQGARIALNKSKEELLEKENALTMRLQREMQLLEGHFIQMQNFGDQLQAQQDEAEIYIDKIASSAGQLNQLLDLLLRAEERQAQAEQQYYQAVCEYNKQITNIHYYKGSLFDLNSVTLQEGEWADKAYWDAEERARERGAGIYFDYGYTRPGVVSNGPVEQGLPTEGNLSRPGSGQFEEVPSIPGEPRVPNTVPGGGNERPKLEKLEDRKPVAFGSAEWVQPASAIEPAETSYNWGDMGMSSNSQANEPARIVANPKVRRLSDEASNSREVPASSRPSVNRSEIWNR